MQRFNTEGPVRPDDHNGYWWSPERAALQTFIDETRRTVNGEVRLKLYKANVLITGRRSEIDTLYRPDVATFEDDRGVYDQRDAEGFIRLNALRMRVAASEAVATRKPEAS